MHLDTLALAQYLSGRPAAALASEEKAIKALKPGPHHERKVFNERPNTSGHDGRRSRSRTLIGFRYKRARTHFGVA